MSKVRKLLSNIYKGNCSEKVKCKCDKLSSKSCFNQFAVLCTISQENASGGAVILYFDPLEFFNWNHRYTSRRNCDSSYAICDLIWLTIINKFLNKNPECKKKMCVENSHACFLNLIQTFIYSNYKKRLSTNDYNQVIKNQEW